MIDAKAGHPDYDVHPGIGPIINWHGRTMDLRQLTPADAEGMAKDRHFREFKHSAVRMQQDLAAAMAKTAEAKTTKAK